MGLDGKIHQTETPWCKTPAEAIKAKADGIRLHEEELKAKARKKEASKKGTVRNAFEEFVKELELEADGTNYQEQISGKMYIHRDANTILNYYLSLFQRGSTLFLLGTKQGSKVIPKTSFQASHKTDTC